MSSNAMFRVMAEPCVMMEKTRVDDGQGGWKNEWLEGAAFDATVVKDNTLAARVAEKQGVLEVYTVTTPPGLNLEKNEVFKRVNDGSTFKVTSNYYDSMPPKGATFQFEQVAAERWELT